MKNYIFSGWVKQSIQRGIGRLEIVKSCNLMSEFHEKGSVQSLRILRSQIRQNSKLYLELTTHRALGTLVRAVSVGWWEWVKMRSIWTHRHVWLLRGLTWFS